MKANDFFRGKEKYNCAQAIAKAFDAEHRIEEFKSAGGGKAKSGLCGALYAAVELTPESQKNELVKRFGLKTGSLTCRELKKNGISCRDCVRIAEEILQESLGSFERTQDARL